MYDAENGACVLAATIEFFLSRGLIGHDGHDNEEVGYEKRAAVLD